MAGGNIKWCKYSGKQLGSFSKAKHTLNMWPTDSIPNYLIKRNEN